QGSTSDVMLMIIERDSDRPIGTVKLGFINWIHQTAEFGIMIGAKQSWGKGYGTEVAELMLGYGFRRLNLHKINLGVAAVHAGAIRSYEKVGFKTEARVRQAAFIDGEYVDKVLMGITQEEYLAKCRES
ncbi:MAG TPA: GNAT family protein, partial [Fimbriimonadaceae bacterium]|nr:GNAT family protein [Fimbriimonadaceae bacterium]